MSTQKILTGFHAVTSRLRQRPETVTEIYLDADRSDARAKDLRELAKRLNVRLISADMKRLDGMADCGAGSNLHASPAHRGPTPAVGLYVGCGLDGAHRLL